MANSVLGKFLEKRNTAAQNVSAVSYYDEDEKRRRSRELFEGHQESESVLGNFLNNRGIELPSVVQERAHREELNEKYNYHSQGNYSPSEVAKGKADLRSLGLTGDQDKMMREYINGYGYDTATGAGATEFLKRSGIDYDTFAKAVDLYKRADNAPFSESSVLTPSETIDYSKLQIENLSKDEKAAVNKITAGNKVKLGGIDADKSRKDIAREMNAANAQIKEGKEALKALGWDDDKIAKYIDYASYISNYELTNEYNQQFNIDKNADKGDKIKGSLRNTAYDLYMAPVRGYAALTDKMTKHPTGLGADVYGMGARALNASEYATEQVVNNAITEDHPIGQKAYQIGLTTAEAGEMALMSAAIPGGQAITLGAYGTQAYASGYKEAKERGASNEQANMYGIAAGSAEVLTEKLSLDHLWGMAKGTKIGKKLVVDWLAQAGIEASEEMVSDLLNRYSDYLILGKDGKNAQTQAIETYMAQGMSEKDAKRKAEGDFWKQVAFDGLAGAVSGGVPTRSRVLSLTTTTLLPETRLQILSMTEI